jgi:hypothetical protein
MHITALMAICIMRYPSIGMAFSISSVRHRPNLSIHVHRHEALMLHCFIICRIVTVV